MSTSLASSLLRVVRTRLVRDYPGQIGACLDALDEEQLWWRPNPTSNAVGNLVLHLAGSNRYYIGHALAGDPNARDRDAEFAARGGQTKQEIRAAWDETVALIDRVLGELDPERLMETTERTGKSTTFAQLLLHVSHHNAVHMGQIVYITKSLRPGAVDDIWMKMRGR